MIGSSAPPDRSDSAGTSVALLACIALSALIFPNLLRGRVFFQGDVSMVWFTQTQVLLRSLAAGSWPVWDPWQGFGQPFLANANVQLFYPPTWLLLLLPAQTYYSLYIFGHLVFGGLGLYLLARHLGLSRGGALLAAGVWMGSGPLLSFGKVWHHFGASAWIPWVLLATDRALTGEGGRRTVAWGLAVALQLLAGSVDVSLFTLLVVAGITLYRLVGLWPSPTAYRKVGARIVVAAALAVALTAAQWLPSMDIVLGSVRSAMAGNERSFWSLHPLQLLQLVFPIFPWVLAAHSPQLMRQPELYIPFVPSIYLGLPALLFALAGIAVGPSDRRRLRLALAVVWLGGIGYALGRHLPLYQLVSSAVPPLRLLRFPSKAMVIPALAWALLVGIGLDAVRGGTGSRKRFRNATLLPFSVATLACLGLALTLTLGAERWGPLVLTTAPGDPTYQQLLAPLGRQLLLSGGLSAAALMLAWWISRGRGHGVVVVLLAGIPVLDLVLAHQGLNNTAPGDFYSIRPRLLEALPRGERLRVYVWDYSLAPGVRRPERFNMVPILQEGVRTSPREADFEMGTIQYLYPPTATRWGIFGSFDLDLIGLSTMERQSMALLLRAAERTPSYLRLLQLGGVDFVVALHGDGHPGLLPVARFPGLFRAPIYVFRVPDPLPRTYAVGVARYVPERDQLKALIGEGFDPRREILLREPPTAAPAPDFNGTSRILEFRPDRVVIEAELNAAGYVVLLDGYERGWKAFVDGRRTPVLRANTLFRAVRVPRGRHIIEQVYRPRASIVGLAISALALALLVTTMLSSSSRSRPPPG
jgi:hypothetical protein